MIKTCHCGKDFETAYSFRKHCSKWCRENYYRKQHKERCASRRKNYDLKRVQSGAYDEQRLRKDFNTTNEWYTQTLNSQGGACAICGTTVAGGRSPRNRFHVDHNHSCCPTPGRSCGKCLRGLLCFNCNLSLGHFETPELLEKALDYLRSFRDGYK